MSPGRREQDLLEKGEIAIVVCSVILAIIIPCDFGTGVLIALVLSVAGVFAAKGYYKQVVGEKSQRMQQAIQAREARCSSDIATNDTLKDSERKKLAADINRKMNQYSQDYSQKAYIQYLVEWLLNSFQIQIDKADRSAWLPQVKASINFSVTCEKIQVPGFGDYDMLSQGIHIDNNPIAVSALAYILEQTLVSQAQTRFKYDQNGGMAVITSKWDKNTSVDVFYSAPNGKVKVSS